MHEQGITEQNQNLFFLRVKKANGTMRYLATGVCFTVVSSILIHALLSGNPAARSTFCEPCSSIFLAFVGYIGFLTSWNEITITVSILDKRFTTTKRNVITRMSTNHEVKFSEIQALHGKIDEIADSTRISIARDNLDTISFQLDRMSYFPLEKYLETLLPKIPRISRQTSLLETVMPTGHVNATC